MSNIKLIVATHKKYQMPTNDIYFSLHVGKEGKDDLGYEGDNSGLNISNKNYSYCELTGLYWAYKNLDYDYLGLVHYRRYFKGKLKQEINGKTRKIISKEEIENILKEYDIILPSKRHYYIETNKSQYVHAHHEEGLIETEKAIKKLYPDYLQAWNNMLNRRSGHRFNMFIMNKDNTNKFCKWLFDILEEVEKNVDISTWDKSEQRIFGYLGERLMDVYVEANKLKVKEQKYFFAEKQNWVKKIFKFLKRKFSKK